MTGRIKVRATVNLPGVKVGHIVEIDPGNSYMAACLRGGLLVHEPSRGEFGSVGSTIDAETYTAISEQTGEEQTDHGGVNNGERFGR